MRPTSKQAPSGLCPAFMLTGGYITEPSRCKSLITRLVNGNRQASPGSGWGFRRDAESPGRCYWGKDRVTTDLDWFCVVAGAAQGCVCSAVPLAVLLPAALGDAGAHFGCTLTLL